MSLNQNTTALQEILAKVNALPEATKPNYTNVLDEVGWTDGVYLSNGSESTDANASTTGYIPVTDYATVYLKNVIMPDESSRGNRLAFYDENKTFKAQVNVTSSLDGWNVVFDDNGNLTQFYFNVDGARYIRMSTWGIDETSIITINEPIITDDFYTTELWTLTMANGTTQTKEVVFI